MGYRYLPSYYNPFTPLGLTDPPNWLTKFKLQRLTKDQCQTLLQQANQRKLISSQPVADSAGDCPLTDVVRVRDFGAVKLSSSFLASCPLALSAALFVEQQARPLTEQFMASRLTRIDHLGSFACRNIYHRPDARRSEHASAQALDISGFRLADGRNISVLRGWKQDESAPGCARCSARAVSTLVTGWVRSITPRTLTIFTSACADTAFVVKHNALHVGVIYVICFTNLMNGKIK